MSELHGLIDLARLPPPPSSPQEWAIRVHSILSDVSSLLGHLADLPIGWFSLIELASANVARLLRPDEILQTRQVKEKFGSLRWYAHVAGADEKWASEAQAFDAVRWATDASATICALYGTADGKLDQGTGWWLTLSPRARELRAAGVDLVPLMYPGWPN